MVGPARGPVRVGDRRAVGADDPHVGERESRLAQRPDQGLELVGMPAVVLVAEGDVLGLGWDHRQGAGEVRVGAAALGRPADDEAPVPADRPLEPRERLVGRAVVGDHAGPVVSGLRPQRLELALEQPLRWLEGGHRDRDRRPGAGDRLGRRPGRGQRQLEPREPAAVEPRGQGQRRRSRSRVERDDAPEDRAGGAGVGELGGEPGRRHRGRHRRAAGAAGGKLEGPDRAIRMHGRPVDEQRAARAGAGRELSRRAEPDAQPVGLDQRLSPFCSRHRGAG